MKLLIISIICVIVVFFGPDHQSDFKQGDIVECKTGIILTKEQISVCKSNLPKVVSGYIAFNWNNVSIHLDSETGGRGTNINFNKKDLKLISSPEEDKNTRVLYTGK